MKTFLSDHVAELLDARSCNLEPAHCSVIKRQPQPGPQKSDVDIPLSVYRRGVPHCMSTPLAYMYRSRVGLKVHELIREGHRLRRSGYSNGINVAASAPLKQSHTIASYLRDEECTVRT